MRKNQFKNQIMYEVEEADIVSKLGVNSVSRRNDYMLPLREVCYNGKDYLVCATENYVKESPGGIDDNKKVVLLKSLSEAMKLCENRAFLECSFIDISNEMLFYDKDKANYRFPVVPVDSSESITGKENWNERCGLFVTELLSGAIFNESLLQFRFAMHEIDDVSDYIIRNADQLNCSEQGKRAFESELDLEYSGDCGTFTLYICKDEFVIGKDDDCDGKLDMNSAISRRHCMFRRMQEGWFIEDLGSSNGTFIGGVRIEVGEPVHVHDGEKIRLSNMEFTAHII